MSLFSTSVSERKPNWVSSTASDAGHRVEPFLLRDRAPDALQALATLIEQQPRTKIVSQTDDRLRAEFRSLLFRFVDDVEFVAVDDRLEVQSASRVGHSDLGVNRRRVEALRAKYAGV